MTVAMSDRDYAVLVEAAGWVRLHSGDDAPEYADLGNLRRVVDGIAQRRPRSLDPLRVVEPREPRAGFLSLLDLREPQAAPAE
jgi:hypothetical protein